MPIVPDDKDWTWVLGRRCPECDFDTTAFVREEVGWRVRDNAQAWPPLLGHALVAERPADDRWSALEYACHVRDVFRLYDTRLHLMLDEDDPTFANWDQDVTAVDERYHEQDPSTVAAELLEAGERLAASFDAVGGDDWSRTGTRSDGARFTVESFARYMVHDPIHHLHDVRQGYARLDARR